MGHVTIERIEDAWNLLNRAEDDIEAGQTAAAVLRCRDALQNLFSSTNGMGLDSWFAPKETTLYDDYIFPLKREREPEPEMVTELVSELRELTRETKKRVEPELHSRIEYEPTARLE